MLSWSEITIRLLLAALLGGVVGIERERKNWTAGLRTHMMVCVGSTLVMIVSTYGFNDVLGKQGVSLDPSRVAAQVISGISFIGGGTILFLRQEVIRGLTTASGLWTVAGIGLATGGGMYFAAGVTTVIALIILLMLKPVGKMFQQYKYQQIKLVTIGTDNLLPDIYGIFEKHKISISNISVDKHNEDSNVLIRFTHAQSEAEILSIISTLNASAYVKQIVWNKAQ